MYISCYANYGFLLWALEAPRKDDFVAKTFHGNNMVFGWNKAIVQFGER